MTRKKQSSCDEIGEILRRTWRHRPEVKLFGKTIIRDNTIPAAILDVIDELNIENRSGLKPVLAQKPIYTNYGCRLILNLPPGVCSNDIENKLQHFEEQAGGTIELTVKGKSLFMDIYTVELPKYVPYDWNPENYPDYAIPLPIGITHDGKLKVIDLAKVPHLFTAGNTGAGKTTELICFVQSLIQTHVARGNIGTIIIDLKRIDFVDYDEHCIVCDTEEMALEALRWANEEMDRRLPEFKKYKAKSLEQYNKKANKNLPYIVVIIDELAELHDKDAQEYLNRLTRLARAPGISVIACTQRPSHTMYKNFTDTKAMFQARICFSVASRQDSEIALGNDTADKLPKNIPGRGIFQWDEQIVIQGMYLSERKTQELLREINVAKVVNFNPDELSPKRLLPR
jgi:S-DNA-T family DNA segregation ATPase FtsK/SpoIIIE